MRREALVKDWGAFLRFLRLAAVESGQIVNDSAIGDARHRLIVLDENRRKSRRAFIICRCRRPVQIHDRVDRWRVRRRAEPVFLHHTNQGHFQKPNF